MTGGLGISRWTVELSHGRSKYDIYRQVNHSCRCHGLNSWRWPAAVHATLFAVRPAPPTARAAAAQLAANGLQQEDHQAELEAQSLEPPPWTPPSDRAGLYSANGRLVLKSRTLPELEAWCASEGEESPANRALQLWRWMYADPPAGHWVRSLEETRGRQNGLSAKFIAKAGERVSLDGGLRLSQVVRAADGTRKLVFTLTEGEAAGGSVETVLIPIVRQQGLRDRLTICVSSQVGCAMNCQFCYTGRMGLLGNLTTAQIVEQVVEARRLLAQEGDRTQLTNLVFMGMGEPLHNTEAVLAAADIVSHYLGLHISHNKITISTVGLVPEMRSVLARSRVQMALSLHATTDEVRDWIVPVNRRYDLATLKAALEELFPKPDLSPKQQQLPPPPPSAYIQQLRQHELEHRSVLRTSLEQEQDPQHSQDSDPLLRPGAVMDEEGTGVDGFAVTESERCTREDSVAEPDDVAGQWLPPLGPTTQHLEVVPAAPTNVLNQRASGGSADVWGSSSSLDEASRGASVASISCRNEVCHAAGTRGIVTAAAASQGSSSNGSGSSVISSSVGGGRSLLVEYTMLHGINDTLEDAHRLVDMLTRVKCKVNLIVFNPHAGTRFQPSTDDAVTAFRSILVQRGFVCTIRDSRGDDEMAACGQLGNVGLAFRPSPILEAPERFRSLLLPPGPTGLKTPTANALAVGKAAA